MSISTLQAPPRGQQKFKFSNILIVLTAILVLALLVFGGRAIYKWLRNMGGKSAIAVDVAYGRADVFFNNENLGVTPVDLEDVKPGENKITLKSSDRTYETTIKFLSNTDKYIHKVGVFRDLGVSNLFSSGQDLWFDESTSEVVLRIISDPIEADVYIDGTKIGKTPYTSSKLTEGDYDIRIDKVGYEEQKARIRIQKGYTSNISVKLFPRPVPSKVSQFEGSEGLFDVSSNNNEITADTKTWVKAVVYWNQTRGINIDDVGLNKELVFDYFIDYNGSVFDKMGNPVIEDEDFESLGEVDKGTYLGRISDGPGLSEPAKIALEKVTKIPTGNDEQQTMVKILPTGVGWLRVRAEATTGSSELAKVDVGNEYVLLEDGVEWVRIKVSDDVEGWVSKAYVEILEPETAMEKMEKVETTTSPPATDSTADTTITDGTAQ